MTEFNHANVSKGNAKAKRQYYANLMKYEPKAIDLPSCTRKKNIYKKHTCMRLRQRHKKNANISSKCHHPVTLHHAILQSITATLKVEHSYLKCLQRH